FLLRFKEILHLAEQEGLSSLPAFLEWWNENGHEEKLPMTDSVDAIRIMTIHKAKGLQFPVVILPFGTNTPKGGGRHSNIIEMDMNGMRLQVNLKKELGLPYYEDLARQTVEAVNVIYVAWTRAVEELYIFDPLTVKPGRNTEKQRNDSLLAMLLENFPLSHDGDEHRVGEAPTPVCNDSEMQIPESNADAALHSENDCGQRPGFVEQNNALAKPSPSPMAWLPHLKIFRNNPAAPVFDAAARGTFIHQCVQYLNFDISPQDAARRAFNHALSHTDLPRAKLAGEEESALRALAWFASLPQARQWLKNGIAEQVIIDETGNNLRCDLLVYSDSQITVVDFKTGIPAEFPSPEHDRQVRRYMDILLKAGNKNVNGVLAYLDAQKLVQI
ncbi:MAG: hypothetical protein IJD04_06560, partial [Desulfovibrionaceae bacterium]|nr:hypothetical protein [Desulfovibrionaceae bacterium]